MWARSYTLRATLAIGFLVLFYVAAVGLALGLLALAWFVVSSTQRFPVKLVIVCVLAAGAILWGILPRWSRFTPPGPELTEAEHPRLFAAIRDVARRMEMQMPATVYLLADVNAFVAQAGGFLGFGGRRIMGIGLGLLAVDNVSQLRAVLAHEFGHFKGGETKLSGLIYATRSAMIRTLQTLRESSASFLQKPFEWMLMTYLRITQSISRQQELLADEWGIRIAGKQAHITGLRNVSLHGTGFSLFMKNEVYPLGRLGVAPDNFFEGYRSFLGSSGWERIQPVLAEALAQETTDPYDSHPATEERIAFVQASDLPDQPMDETPAYTLLSNTEAVEKRCSEELRPQELKPIAWSEAGALWSALWKETADRVQARVPDFSLAQVPVLLRDSAAREAFAESINPRLVSYLAPDRAERVQRTVSESLGAWLGSVLAQQGLRWTTSPGEPLKLEREGARVDPQALVKGLLDGSLAPEELERLRSEHHLAETATWSLSEQARQEALEPVARVSLTPLKKGTQVQVQAGQLILPQCCALCCGSMSGQQERQFPLNRMLQEDLSFTFHVPTCDAHAHQAPEAFRMKNYEQASDTLTFEVSNSQYAALFPRVNA